MQHANILRRDYMYELTRLQMANLYKVRFECKEIRVRQGEGQRFAFPIDQPIWPGSPAISVDEEREIGVVEEEFAVEPFDGDGDDVFSGDKVKRGIRMVEKRLRFECFKADDFEATRAGDAELRPQEVDGRRFRGHIEFLQKSIQCSRKR